MTKTRRILHRELFGILGPHPDVRMLLRAWNARFLAHGLDASMDRYPAKAKDLPERLSEMFHFDRRGYIIAPSLSRAIIPLLDELEGEAEERGEVDTVRNDGGMLKGNFLYGDEDAIETYWRRS